MTLSARIPGHIGRRASIREDWGSRVFKVQGLGLRVQGFGQASRREGGLGFRQARRWFWLAPTFSCSTHLHLLVVLARGPLHDALVSQNTPAFSASRREGLFG